MITTYGYGIAPAIYENTRHEATGQAAILGRELADDELSPMDLTKRVSAIPLTINASEIGRLRFPTTDEPSQLKDGLPP